MGGVRLPHSIEDHPEPPRWPARMPLQRVCCKSASQPGYVIKVVTVSCVGVLYQVVELIRCHVLSLGVERLCLSVMPAHLRCIQ